MAGRDWDTISPVVTSKIVMFPSMVRSRYFPEIDEHIRVNTADD
jgi:hypothetical protein